MLGAVGADGVPNVSNAGGSWICSVTLGYLAGLPEETDVRGFEILQRSKLNREHHLINRRTLEVRQPGWSRGFWHCVLFGPAGGCHLYYMRPSRLTGDARNMGTAAGYGVASGPPGEPVERRPPPEARRNLDSLKDLKT